MRVALKAIVLILIFVISSDSLFAAQDVKWKLRNYVREHGLAQNSVTAFVQDKNGLIWLGTQNGLHRFDGFEFEVFNRHKSGQEVGLESDYIISLHVNSSGTLFVGTATGLHRYIEEKNQFQVISGTKKTSTVLSITSREGVLWAGLNDGLYRLSADGDDLIYENFKGQSVSSLITTEFGLNAVIDTKSVISYVPSSKIVRTLFSNDINQTVHTLYRPDKNHLLIATNYGLFNYTEGTVSRTCDGFFEAAIALTSDELGYTYVSTGTDVFRFSATSDCEKVEANYPLNQVISMFVDENGLAWLGTQNDGLYLQSANSNWITSVNTDKNSRLYTVGTSVTAVDFDNESNVWLGSSMGVTKLDFKANKTTEYLVGDKHSGIDSQVSVITVDSKNNVWTGYRNGPLAKYNASTDRFEVELGGIKVFITDIIELTSTKLLFTTRNNGVFLLNTNSGKTTHFSSQTVNNDKWSTNRFQTSLRVTEDIVWLGTFDDGLYLFNTVTSQILALVNQTTSNALKDNLIVSLHAGVNDQLYVGTASGLTLFDSDLNSIDQYDDIAFLDNETIYGIVEDPLGFFWFATDNGLVRLDKTLRYAQLYSEEDGLPNDEFNSNALTVINNEIIAGGVKGLARLNSELVPVVDYIPTVQFNDFYLSGKKVDVSAVDAPLNKSINLTKSINLDYFQNAFSFAYAAVNYQTPLKLSYQYRLTPFEKEWTTVDYKRRLATYTNLDSGRYQFEIRASIDGVRWGEARLVQVTISPAPWFSPVAYAIYLASILSLLLLALSLIKRKREYERQAFIQISKKEQELSLALWGSGDEFWNYDVRNNRLFRRNSLSSEHVELPDGDAQNYQETQSGDEFEAIIHPDDLNSVRHALTSCVLEGVDSFELAYRLKDEKGNWFWALGKGQVSERDPTNGKPILISGANKNIDNLKQAEESLKLANDDLEGKVKERTKELLAANEEISQTLSQLRSMQEKLVESEKMASLGNMVAGIAHEINTPLGVAITSLSYSEKSMADLLSAAENKVLTTANFNKLGEETMTGMQLAQRNLNRAGELVNSFKQVSVDQSSEQIRSFNLEQLLRDTVMTLKPKLRNTKVEVNIKVPSDINLVSYPGLLSQVIVNFVSNSLTHAFVIGESGSIDISVIPNSDESILLIYKDSGSGIVEEDWERVFEPFFTTNRNKGNTGLGMHISYNLVTQKLAGEILLNSPPGQGVEFYIHLPTDLNKIDKSLSQSQ